MFCVSIRIDRGVVGTAEEEDGVVAAKNGKQAKQIECYGITRIFGKLNPTNVGNFSFPTSTNDDDCSISSISIFNLKYAVFLRGWKMGLMTSLI